MSAYHHNEYFRIAEVCLNIHFILQKAEQIKTRPEEKKVFMARFYDSHGYLVCIT